MTDLPLERTSIPTRLGVSLAYDAQGRLSGHMEPALAVCDRGVVPAYAIVFLVDAAAGVSIDLDPDSWSFTSDLSVRVPLAPVPAAIDCTPVEIRGGRRSSTCEAPLVVDGESWGHCFIGFSRVPRREGDPPKVPFSAGTAERMKHGRPLEEPLRVAGGFRSIDPSHGVVAADLRPDLLNPAGAMQGAMVAGLAETAAQDLADHLRLLGTDVHVVTEIEVRYLAQNRVSPIVAQAWVVGTPERGLVRVDLVDDGGQGRLTTSVLIRVAPAPI